MQETCQIKKETGIRALNPICDIIENMNQRLKIILSVLAAVLFSLGLSGCRMTGMLQITPVPLETATPKISLNQVTSIPTLPYVTPSPTPPIGDSVRYQDPSDIFLKVKEENLPENPYEPVVIFGTFAGFTSTTDVWGNVTSGNGFKISHHSGAQFSVTCDNFCFYVDANKNLIKSTALKNGSEVIIIGASGESADEINADLVAIHTLAEQPRSAGVPNMSGLPSGMTYTEYELNSFPALSPIRISGAGATATPLPTATTDPYAGYGAGADVPYAYNYSYYYDYSRPTSTPNRPPTETPTPASTDEPQILPTEDLNDRLEARLNHTLSNRTSYSYGAYGEQYSVYIEYDDELNRDPKHPTRAEINVESNGYAFTEYWLPYIKNPMFYNWGVVCYAGDWYLSLRGVVDIDPEPGVADLVYSDRTIRSQQNFDEQMGYLRSFGFSIIDRKLFYFYQKENGYGISINRQDFDLGFDDIPFGYVGGYTEIDPFYSDDLITFFGHRGGRWYYVELNAPELTYW